MVERSFDNLMIIGRGGCGKSELIDYVKHIDETERLEQYHIGAFDEVDDFPWLLQLFEEEDLWERLGRKRRFSERVDNLYKTTDYEVYNFTILKFGVHIQKTLKKNPDYYASRTLFIEFARGRDRGYRTALDLFDADVLRKTAIIYLDNTFEESMRRNEVRSPGKTGEQSILFHKVPVDVMEYLYKTHDWYELTDKKPEGYVKVNGVDVPFATVWNMPESHDDHVLEGRYGPPIERLWKLYADR
jgi:hypothetical protein